MWQNLQIKLDELFLMQGKFGWINDPNCIHYKYCSNAREIRQR